MNFDEAYEKLKNGTASEEERLFVDKEIESIRKIRSILDNPPERPEFEEAQESELKKFRKRFNRRTTVKIAAMTVAALLIIAAIVCGVIFIPACSAANKCREISKEEGIVIAKDFLESEYEDMSSFSLRHFDTEIRINGKLDDAVFVYRITFKNEFRVYVVEVSSRSGYAELFDSYIHR